MVVYQVRWKRSGSDNNPAWGRPLIPTNEEIITFGFSLVKGKMSYGIRFCPHSKMTRYLPILRMHVQEKWL